METPAERESGPSLSFREDFASRPSHEGRPSALVRVDGAQRPSTASPVNTTSFEGSLDPARSAAHATRLMWLGLFAIVLIVCVAIVARNPKTVQQWVPYIGPGDRSFGGDRALVLQTMSQSISVTLDCNRR